MKKKAPKMSSLEYSYYQHCRADGKPYFGTIMQAAQGSPIRHAYMQGLVQHECRNRDGKPLFILEIGSWAGGSSITWADALKKFNERKGKVVCIDPWRMYFPKKGEPFSGEPTKIYREMAEALENEEIFDLFLHNIRASGCEDLIFPFRGTSENLLPLFGDKRFDVVFIDGDHRYSQVLKDLEYSSRLVGKGGILCGDDLELPLSEIDADYARKNRDKDYILDPKTNQWYHPGVSLALGEYWGDVSAQEGFWMMRKIENGWEKIEWPDLHPDRMPIPEHIQVSLQLAEENYRGFNLIRYRDKYYGMSQALGPLDLTQLDEEKLASYREKGMCLTASSLEEIRQVVDRSNFRGSPELVEEGFKGFNIVHYQDKFYALSLKLGHVDLTRAEGHILENLGQQGLCYMGKSPRDVKQAVDQTLIRSSPGPAAGSISKSPDPRMPQPLAYPELKGKMFSRELCLNYDRGAEDLQCLQALVRHLLQNGLHLAFYGATKLSGYILEAFPQIKPRVRCVLDADPRLQGTLFHDLPVISPQNIPTEIDLILMGETRWRGLQKMRNHLPGNLRTVTLDVLPQIAREVIPARAWVEQVKNIYPLKIPEIEFQPEQDMILIDLPARTLAQMPAGLAFVHQALKKSGVRFQTVDLDVIIYHRFHSHRMLDGVRKVKTSKGYGLPEDPWQPVHYLEWDKPEFLEYFHPEMEEIAAGLIQARPKIIGVSLQQASIGFAREVVKRVREKLPGIIVLVGGMSCLQPLAAKMIFPEADYTVVGEADLVVGPLVQALARGEWPSDLPGVWSRKDTPGREFIPGPLVGDLDSLEHPRYEWTDIQLYRNWNGYQLTPIIGSRGCRWSKCRFCAECFPWRPRTPERVVDELEWLSRQSFSNFVFNESDLHGDPKLIERMCDEILRRRLRIQMTCQLRCHPKVGPEYFRKLKAAGFVCLRFGIDGASENALRLQRKGYKKDVVRRNIKDSAEAGIYNEVNLVIGVPGETEEDINEAITFLSELKPYIGRLAYINPLMLFRGSDYWDHPEEYGIVFRKDKEDLYRNYPVAAPDDAWYSTDPYIDKEIRYQRLTRVVRALRQVGVPLGDFANYVTERVADTLTREKMEPSSPPGQPTSPAAPSEIYRLPSSSPKKKALFICNSPPKKALAFLDHFCDYEITLFPLNGFSPSGSPFPRLHLPHGLAEPLPSLRAHHFDAAIIPHENRLFWDRQNLVSFAASFIPRVILLFSNGKVRLYEGEDLHRLQYNTAYLQNLFRYASSLRGKRVLEIGCSDGLVCDWLTSEDPLEIIGIDTLETVGSRYPDPQITYKKMDASHLFFEDQSLDLAFTIATLEHCPEPLSVLEEMRRVLMAGGIGYVQAGPLYYSPFGHHMFGFFDDFPWIHLRLSPQEILAYSQARGIDKKVKFEKGMELKEYLEGMLSYAHINGKSIREYRLDRFLNRSDVEVLNFSKSYEGKILLNKSASRELAHIPQEDLVTHGFELIFRVRQ